MSSLIINGPSKLKGKVQIQGAKNSAMKHIFIPMITNDIYTLENIPKIGSINNHLDLMHLLGSKITWHDKNTISINTKNISEIKRIPKESIYYTSGGCHIIPIIASKYGKCEIELDPERIDYGGDQIGSRRFKDIVETLKQCGYKYKRSESYATFLIDSRASIKLRVPGNSFGASVNILFSSLFKNGKSTIIDYSHIPEFEDILNLLMKAEAKIIVTPRKLEVFGPAKLKGVTYKNMNDPHDLATWIFAGLTTSSEITIEGIEYEKMKLDVLEKILRKMNVEIDLHSYSTIIKPQLRNIKPIKVYSGSYPMFTTEWQVLISPLLTQIKGESKVVETLFANRMQHWNEMAKMGIHTTFFKDPHFPEVESMPRAVKVSGPQKLHGTKVDAHDVRTGAALIIAGLIAEGKTIIQNAEHIDRGYEAIDKRLNTLGVRVKRNS